MSIDERYEDLAHAIVKSAAEDYRRALRGKGYEGKSARLCRYEIEKFFRSRYFEILTGVRGDYLITMLKRERRSK